MKKQLLILMTLCISVIAYSQAVGDTFVEDYITYEVTSVTPNEVETTGYNSTGGTVVNIPATVTNNLITYTVTTAGFNSFNGKGLTAVTFPNSIISIGQQSFANNSLTSVTFPNSVVNIGSTAFNLNSLTHVTIPSSVTDIGFAAFRDNPLATVTSQATNPATVVTGGINDSFWNRSVIDLTIPSGTSAAYAAGGWTGFNSVTEAVPPAVGDIFIVDFITYQVTSISPNTVKVNSYDHINGGTDVDIPATVSNGGSTFSVTSIGNSGFEFNGADALRLTSVIIPNSVTSIGEDAFLSQNLITVTIPDSVTSIGFSAFVDNDLTSVIIGNNVETIGAYAFGINQLTNIIIPNSVISIGNGAFNSNPLTSVTSLATTPPSITTGTNDTFGSITNRGSINLTIPVGTTGAYVTDAGALWTGFNSVTESGSAQIGDTFVDNFITYQVTSLTPNEVEAIDYDTTGGTVVDIPASVSDNAEAFDVTSIGDGAFINNQITSLTIAPNSVIAIGENAFQGNQLTNVVVPNGVTTIGRLAFSNNQITSIDLADTVTTIDDYVFESNNVSDITDVVFPIGLTEIPIGFFYLNQFTNLTLPNSITSIGDEAFGENQLTNVTFHNNLTNIGSYAFGDNQIGSLTIPDSVTSICGDAFYTNLLTSITFGTGLTIIEQNVFQNNLLTSVTVPDGITSIVDQAFENNMLSSIVLPSTLIEIHEGAFRDNALTSVIFPSNLENIWFSAFLNNQIQTISLPSSLTYIDNNAFFNNQLTTVTIPENVTNIDPGAFNNNPLTDVISLAATPPVINSSGSTGDTFASDRSTIHLHIPAGTMGAYVTDTGALWTGFNPVTEDALSVTDFELANTIKVITTTNEIQVVSPSNATLENYELYSITGVKVKEGKENTIATDVLSAGVYILKLNFNKGTVVKKVAIN